MKQVKAILFVIITAIAFSACTWQIPERITLKTQAEYNFTLGAYHEDISENLTVDKLFDGVSINNSRVYDYFPGKKDAKTQQYYMRIPLLEIPIDFSSFFESSGLAESVERMSFAQDIKIPSVKMNFSQNADVSSISRTLNSALTVKGPVSYSDLSFSFDFDSITYDSGYMTISSPGVSDGVTVTLSNDSESRSGSFRSGSAKINIGNFTFYDDEMVISFSKSFNQEFVGTIDASSSIRKAQGVSMDSEVVVPVTINVSASTDDSFEYCVVGQGTLESEISVPSDWTNVDISYEVTSSGAMSINSPRTEGEDKSINLTGTKIGKGNIAVTAKLYLELSNASFSLGRSPVLKCESNISSFSKIAMNLESVNTELIATESMTESMLESVKSITLKSSGLKGTFVNTLPAGNDIQISASSDFLGLLNGKGVLSSNTSEGKFSIMSPENTEKFVKIARIPTAKNEYNSWDFLMKIQFPGATQENPSRIEISNVSPGNEYKISMSVAPETNWKEMVVDASDMNRADVSPVGFNLISAFSALGDTLGIDFDEQSDIHSVPTYIYCNKPRMKNSASDPFGKTSFSGSIKMFVGQDNGASIDKIKDASGKDREIVFSKAERLNYVSVPNLEFNENTIITDVGQYEYTKLKDIASLVNNTKGTQSLYLDYDVQFSNGASQKVITVTPDMIDKTTSAASIGVSAVVIIPFKFDANNGDILINIKKMMGEDEDKSDILGRTEASPDSTLEELSDVMRSMSIYFKTNAMPLYATPDIKLVLDLNCGLPPKIYNIQSGTINIDAGEIAQIFATYPVYTTMNCLIAENSLFSIPRVSSLDMSLNLKIATDGSIDILGGR